MLWIREWLDPGRSRTAGALTSYSCRSGGLVTLTVRTDGMVKAPGQCPFRVKPWSQNRVALASHGRGHWFDPSIAYPSFSS